MWWLLTTIGVYLHLLTYVERCDICYDNVYWKPKCKCRDCGKAICCGCVAKIITDPELNYKCPHCRTDNQIHNLQVLNKDFFLTLWKTKTILFKIDDGEGQH